ncbi:nitroreductase family protein [Candidatus Wirthbacteria bacterium CG2_30_54_11]|uniref:Nitroreductase family protein n=1 Tax=Candidatus Wirthbacteria bacterium CG2_30_54_11 TaxID=1817892 RepID=A0A1J5IZU5_9BACT|nr:MAG: nitroreductase family protein [Candidatus Wirthbacteria bacterium CG2_30_54_11]
MDAVFTRRSIRSYTDEPVSDDQIEHILRAGMAAPSANNQQPWHFVVITDRELLRSIASTHPHAKMAAGAAAAILVCGNSSVGKTPGFWIQDCSAAVENMLIEIQDLELGAVWCGVYPKEDLVREMRRLVSVPEPYVPFALIPLGHPAETKRPSNRYDGKRVHRDRWGKQ